MKKLVTFLAGIACSMTILFAQEAPPQALSFKATIKDNRGRPILSRTINLRISILQGDRNGPAVYSEYFTPYTNQFSQVDIVIGRGTSLSGSFQSIDWSAGEYYLKIELDARGGTNYTLLSVTQLLSVPFALYAASAGNAFSGNYDDLNNKPSLFDGTWDALIGKPYFSSVTFTGSYNDLTGKPVTDGSETKVSAGTNVTVTGGGTEANPYVIASTTGTDSHYIGEVYGGGIVAFVYDNGRHGLIAATSDQSHGAIWVWDWPDEATMARADGIGAGRSNTAIIIARQGYDNQYSYAARICNEYSVTVDGVTYGDWYLPSKYELNLLYLQKDIIGNFSPGGIGPWGFIKPDYWSSTESDTASAWAQFFDDGVQFTSGKFHLEDRSLSVRAVRTF